MGHHGGQRWVPPTLKAGRGQLEVNPCGGPKRGWPYRLEAPKVVAPKGVALKGGGPKRWWPHKLVVLKGVALKGGGPKGGGPIGWWPQRWWSQRGWP